MEIMREQYLRRLITKRTTDVSDSIRKSEM